MSGLFWIPTDSQMKTWQDTLDQKDPRRNSDCFLREVRSVQHCIRELTDRTHAVSCPLLSPIDWNHCKGAGGGGRGGGGTVRKGGGGGWGTSRQTMRWTFCLIKHHTV